MSGPIYLIDGYALIYRAFFAMISRPLRTSRGENTSAVWGVANFLHRLFEQYQPDHVAWVHDSGTSFRTDTYPEYKATRTKLDEELQEDFDRSLERIQSLLEAFRVTLVEVPGYEADDVIGTLATRAEEIGKDVVIVSGDKDFYQLISEHVTLLNPGRGGPAAVEEQRVDQTNAADRLGVPPELVVDYLALVGDSSDNVPGVKGVGAKTAKVLIDAYGDLDGILAHAEEVKGKRAREALLAYEENARLSRDLVTIRRDVPTADLDLDAFAVRPPDTAALTRIYTELEFHTLVSKLEAPEVAEAPVHTCVVVTTAAGVAPVVEAVRAADVVVIHAVTAQPGTRRGNLVGLSLALADGRSWYLPFGHRTPDGELLDTQPVLNLPSLSDEAMQPLVRMLQDGQVSKAGHDVKDTWLALRSEGVELAGVVFDSMLASFVLDPGRRSHALPMLAVEQLGTRISTYELVVGKGKERRPFDEIPTRAAADYCSEITLTVSRLRGTFDTQLTAMAGQPLFHDVEVPLVGVLVDMEWRGIAIDTERLGALSRDFGATLQDLEREIHKEAGGDFNINSTPQLRHVLFEKLQLPVIKRTKTGPSTDAEVLGQLAAMGFEVPRLLLDYRELTKLRSTYVDVLPDYVNPHTGRIHTRFNQTGAATGRLSSYDPNLQNIPVRTPRGEQIRQCFVAVPGTKFIVADYSQIELRLLAHLSEDPAFIAAFKRGDDIHRETAAIIFDIPVDDVTADMRARAKTINFATIYGQGPFALGRQLDISQDEAREFIKLYFERFAGVRRFLDETIERARDTGYVETILGRRRYIPELKDPAHNVRALGERTAMNSPMQGSAADLIKVAMIRLAEALRDNKLETELLLQVHDELVLEAPEAEIEQASAIVRREMEGAADLCVDLVVDIGVGPNWLDAKR